MALNALRWSEFMWHRVLQGHSGVQWIQAIELAAWKDAGGIVLAITSYPDAYEHFSQRHLLCTLALPCHSPHLGLSLRFGSAPTASVPHEDPSKSCNLRYRQHSGHEFESCWNHFLNQNSLALSLRSSSSLAIPIANSRKLALVSFPCSFMISRPEVNKRMSRVTAENIKHAFSIFPTYIPSTSLNFNLQISSNIFKSIQIARFQSFSGKSRNLFCDPQAFTCAPGVLGFGISDQSTPSPARSIPEPLRAHSQCSWDLLHTKCR